MIRDLLLVHHSHTDIGYTHPQPVVMELQRRYIDAALDLSEETADWPDGSRFKWTCEVTGTTLDWWQHASKVQQQRFLDAVGRGQLEVAALGWNMTPLMDHQMLLEVLDAVAFFRSQGIPVKSAMNSDVNGLPWGTVEALLDHGITGLSMAINEHFGYAVQPRPGAFRWESPSGRNLLVWNGFIYGVTVEQMVKIPVSHSAAAEALPRYLQQWEERGYPYTFMMMQATNVPWHDNAPPNPALAPFVRRWNADGHEVRLHIVTLSEVFDRLRREAPETVTTLRGDWTDWWNFGSGSTARETTLALEGQRALREAEQLQAWPGVTLPRQEELLERARHSLALYAEHTWGADRSVWKHTSPETHIQKGLKLATALEGLSLARMLRRDGLERLATDAGGESLTALFYNPLPHPVSRILRVPLFDRNASRGLANLAGEDGNLQHRQDVLFSDYSSAVTMPWLLHESEAKWVGPLALPALGYATWPYAELPAAQGELHADDDSIGNTRLRLRFDRAAGGVSSLLLDGREFVRPTSRWRLGQPVLETPSGGKRSDIFGPPDYRAPNMVHRLWHPDWQAVHSGPRVLASHVRSTMGCAEYVQLLELPSGDRITNHYRLFPGEPSLELETVVDKAPLSSPHALYLAFPIALDAGARCHFETAGAIVELDREQLPYSARHYLTTQRFIRLQDDGGGLTVACPDAPLWQVGGFSFGRHRDGVVDRANAMLAAWLTNNYWDTNFQADQSGELRFRFRIIPHVPQDVAESATAALAFAVPPQLHIYKERGPRQFSERSLFDLDLSGAFLTGIEATAEATLLYFLNPTDTSRTLTIGPGRLVPTGARITNLAGTPGERIPCTDGYVAFTLGPRAWTALTIEHHMTTLEPPAR